MTKSKTIREIKTVNLSINSNHILREVIDNMKVSYEFTKRELEIIRCAVETTLWEVFARKEERLRLELKDKSRKWEFK